MYRQEEELWEMENRETTNGCSWLLLLVSSGEAEIFCFTCVRRKVIQKGTGTKKKIPAQLCDLHYKY